jgi:hypothetical protein
LNEETKMLTRLLHIILLFSFGQLTYGQSVAEAVYSADSLKIGEQFILNLTFTTTKSEKDSLVWPKFDNFLTNQIEIVQKSDLKKIILDSVKQTFQYKQNFALTSFDVGPNPIPSIKITYDDSVYTTQPYQIIVSTVAVDTSKGIYDIKPVYEVDYKLSNQLNDWFSENWHWLVIFVLIIIIAFLIYKFRKRPVETTVVAVPQIPAHVSALNVLRALAQSKAWESDDKKAYYSSVTDTVRKYLEERFDIQAMEETTVEIIKDLKYSDILSKDKFFLQEILKQADMVKFAKFKPDNQDGQVVLEKSIEFVERTKTDYQEHNIKENKNV